MDVFTLHDFFKFIITLALKILYNIYEINIYIYNAKSALPPKCDFYIFRQLAISSKVSLIRSKVKSCYNPLRLGTVIALISSDIHFVNTPRLYSNRATC